MRMNEKGSTLVYAVVVISVVSIVVAAAMAISYSYYNRSLINHRQRQAYLCAKSVVTDISKGIMDHNAEYTDLIPTPPTRTTSVFTIGSTFPSEIGKIDKAGMFINIKKDEVTKKDKYYILTVYVTATFEQETVTINADFERDKNSADNTVWTFLRYYEGDVVLSHNIQIAENLLDQTSKIREYAQKYIEKDTSENYKQKLIDYLLNEGKDILPTSLLESLKKSPFVNDILRSFVYAVFQGSGSQDSLAEIKLDVDEFEMSSSLKNRFRDNLYLHIMFGYEAENQKEARYFIYASTTPETDKADWAANFIYLPETKHWYYNGDPMGMNVTTFDSMASLNKVDEQVAKKLYDSIISKCIEAHIVQ